MVKLSYLLCLLGVCCLAAFISGYFYGRHVANQNILTTTIIAFENRKHIEDEISEFSPYDLCLALGGMPDNCAPLLRGLDTTTTTK